MVKENMKSMLSPAFEYESEKQISLCTVKNDNVFTKENDILNIPDKKFRKLILVKVLNKSIHDGRPNYNIYASDLYRLKLCKTLDMTGFNVEDTKGLEYFMSLTILRESENDRLTSLDISNNKKLEAINIFRCGLTSLDVSNNKYLERLSIYENNLTKLDVSNNKYLKFLIVTKNKLKELDISKNKALRFLVASNNCLRELDVSKNKCLEFLAVDNNNITELDVTKNKNLSVLYVQEKNLTKLDLSKNKDLEFLSVYNKLSNLDVSKNKKLISFNRDNE